MTDPVEPKLERFARQFIINSGGNPDQLVQPGTPRGFGTPMGDAFAIIPEAATPLWRMYISVARVAMDLARTVDVEPQAAE